LRCPQCGRLNWHGTGGDISDPEADAIRCWSCKTLFLLIPYEDVVICSGEDPEDWFVEEGSEEP
jgi:hypothetical protein